MNTSNNIFIANTNIRVICSILHHEFLFSVKHKVVSRLRINLNYECNEEKWILWHCQNELIGRFLKKTENDKRMSKIQLLFPNVGTAAAFDVSVTLSG